MRKIPTFEKICAECGRDYIARSPVSKFCTVECRTKQDIKSGKRKERWTKANRKAQYASYKEGKGKSQCLICGAWVKAPAMHAYQKHRVNAREYKEAFQIPNGKGLIPVYLKEIKREHVFANKTVENLKKGSMRRFKKGEERCLDGVKKKLELGQIKSISNIL